jgi:hypothetical protein
MLCDRSHNNDARRARRATTVAMRRDWPLVASGVALVVVSAAAAIPAIGAYRPDDPPCTAPKPPAVMIDGCYRRDGGFDVWISQPGVVIFLALALLILVVAMATIRRGLAPRDPAR